MTEASAKPLENPDSDRVAPSWSIREAAPIDIFSTHGSGNGASAEAAGSWVGYASLPGLHADVYVGIGHELPENSDDENFLSYPPKTDVVIYVPEQHVYNDGVGISRKRFYFRIIPISHNPNNPNHPNHPNKQSIQQNPHTKHTCSSPRLLHLVSYLVLHHHQDSLSTPYQSSESSHQHGFLAPQGQVLQQDFQVSPGIQHPKLWQIL